ncbi:TonB-linked outer membrane protein, SusC/RagA family [Prevotella sp. khp1]|jgi:TonB-linked SusC/RagA family outer membrane protein|uniref:SusC/RagA family TonB-linked outer membrane protein n=1 Tax=Prevotellaceae TaxID=171552 RepID=UPI000880B0BC|nr:MULTISPECIES: SusC/RagA family TonB-linked outer membrane protein [Prevotellaceae]QVJ82144.1 SusC/RagA family TonB-linked outer membrane protein [Xylanibacter ruminicola]SDQ33085.1 TonB-linked outer membrane protein, SusC/RagA family [Prevotella sp. khp1]
MKHIIKNIALGAALLPVAAVAQTEKEYTDSVASQVNVAFRTVNEADLMGGVSTVNMVEQAKKDYTTYSLDGMDALVGGYNGQLWNQGEALVLVDGVPRDASNVLPTEIEQITFLKAASAVVLYGSRAAKGVILITTKHGRNDGLNVSVRGNASLYVPKSYPKYLGSAAYMELYNEALQNDGKAAVYSEDDIYHYASNENPYRYPNINFFDSQYIKKTYQRYDGTAEFSGGGRLAHFYANIGLSNVGSLMNFGEGKNNHTTRLNVRGNIDLRLNDWIDGYVNANATFYDARNDNSNFWSESATMRPTSQYPLVPFIPISYVEEADAVTLKTIQNSNYIIDGKYFLGGTQSQQTNPFAAMYAAGYNKYTSRQMQFDMGMNFDLNSLVKGLKLKTKFAVDYHTQYNTSINNEYAVYEAKWNNYSGQDLITSITKYGTDKRTGTQNLSNSHDKQLILMQAQLDYDRSFGDHNLNATLLAHGYQISEDGKYHRTSNANLGLQLAYNYAHTYYADLSMAAIHSAKLAEGHREAISPVVSLGWRLKNESFLRNVKAVDDLKLTASYGIINQDLDIEKYYMYDYVFTATGTWWGWNEVANSMQTSDSQQGSNYNLGFIKRKEFRAGLTGSLWEGALKFDANFFTTSTNGLLTTASTIYPSYFQTYWPVSTFLANTNYNNQRRTGVDLTLNVHQKFGEFDTNFGVSAMYYTSKNTKWDENVEYDWLKAEGQSIEAMRGYECLGFFKDADDVANSAKINNNTKPGDLKYKDQNGDGIIDSKDQVVIGKWTAPFQMGVHFTVKYKDFTLFAQGSGTFGGNGLKNGKDTWVYGDGKYSDVVLNRWTPETASTATYPRLTTESGDLNFVASDFWKYSTSAFRLNKVQLTYDLPQSIFAGDSFVKGVSVYVSGSNLLTIAKERKYMELNVGTAPQTRMYNLGVKVNL